MTTKKILVQHWVEVTVDESKFTEEFIQEYRNAMDRSISTVKEHMLMLATLFVEGVASGNGYLEGYGNLQDFGVRFEYQGTDAEIDS